MLLNFAHRRSFVIQRWVETTMVADAVWVLRTYWKRIVLCVVLGLTGTYGYNRWYPEGYVSRATVRFIPPQVAEQYVTSNVMEVEQRIFAITQMLRSRLTATQLIERYRLYPQRRRFYPVADLVPDLQDDLHILTIAGERGADKRSVPSIEISFRYANPETAQRVVQRIVELIYEENRRYRSDQSIGTTDFLQQEVKAANDQIVEIEEQLAMLPRPGGEAQGYEDLIKVENLHDLERRLTDLGHQMNYVMLDRNLRRSVVTGLENRIKAKIEAVEKRVPSETLADTFLRTELANVENQVEDLQRRYRPGVPERVAAENALARARKRLAEQVEHSQMSEFGREIEELEAQLTRARSELAGYEATLQRQSADEARLRQELAGLRAEFSPKEDLENERLNLLRQYQVAKEQYATLMKRQGESVMASNMERRGQGETAEMVEPPTLPLRAEWPNEPMVYTAGGLLGLFCGFGLGLLSFFANPRVRLAGHVRILSDVPVWAALPPGLPGRRSSVGLADSTIASAMVAVTLAMAVACAPSGPAARDQALRSGRRAMEKGDFAAAIIRYKRAIQIDAKSGEAYFRLSEAFLATGQLALAQEQLIRAGELLPERAEVQERLAEATYRLYFADPGRPAALLREVEQLAQRLREKWPRKASGHRLLAQVLVERRHFQEAIDLMERVLERLEDGSIRTQLASVYYQNGDKERAEENLRACIEASPLFSPGYDLLYLQLMEQHRMADAREVLAAKTASIDTLDTGLQLAAHDEANGAKDRAEQLLAHLAQRWKGDPEAYAHIGDFWLHRTDWERARYWYESGRTLHPSLRPLYTGRMADLMMARKDVAGARALVEAELRRRPNEGLMIAYQAALKLEAASDAQDLKQTQARLESLLARMPNSPFVRLHLGRAYLLNGDAVKASEHIQNAVTLDPNYAPGWLALAEAELRVGNAGLAQEHLDALLRRSPGYAPARLLKAQASLQMRKPADAETALAGLVQAEPENTEALLLLARAKLALGRGGEAKQLLARAVSLAPGDVRLMMEQARLDLATGDNRQALARLRGASNSPAARSPEFQALLASVALMAGESTLAVERFRALVDGNPSNLEFRLGYASALGMVGKRDEAARQFQQVQQTAGNDVRPWLLYGALMASTSNSAAERQAYEEALRRDPQNPYALNNLAFLLARQGVSLDQALGLAERARRSMPNNWEVNDTLAYVYLRLGLTRNAVATLEEVSQAQRGPQLEKTRGVIEQLRRGELAEVRRQMEQSVGDRN